MTLPSRLAFLVIAPILIQAQSTFAATAQTDNVQRASLITKPGVVRVLAGCSGKYAYYGDQYALVVGEIGSGYFVDSSGYVVTNAHVLTPGEEAGCRESLFRRFVAMVTGEKDFKKISEQEKNEIQQRSQIAGSIDYVNRVVLPTGESLPFETKQEGKAIAGDPNDIAVIKVKVSNVPTVRLQDFSRVEAQKAVITLGYPLNQNFASLSEAPLLKKLPTDELPGKAIVFGGQVAAGSQNPTGDRPVLLFDTTVPTGLAGSPVVNKQGDVIGMMSFSGSEGVQQGNAAALIPSGSVLRLLEKAGGSNQEGAVDRLYREGLDLLDKGNFAAAKIKFSKVKTLFPSHSEAEALIGDSDQGIAQAQRKQNKVIMLGAGAAVVALLVLVFLLRTNKVRTIAQYWLGRSPSASLEPETPTMPVPPVPPTALKKPFTPAPDESFDSAMKEPAPVELRPLAAVSPMGSKSFNSPTVIGTQQFIELKNQDGQVRRFYLSRELHRLGRDRDWADLHTPDIGWEVLSRHHAMLEKEGSDYRIYDGDRHTASTNGILLNGVPITLQQGHLLQDGDRLQTGDDPRNQVIWTYSNPGKPRAANL